MTHRLAVLAATTAVELDNARLGRESSFAATEKFRSELELLARGEEFESLASSVFARAFGATTYGSQLESMRELVCGLDSPGRVAGDRLPSLRDRCLQISDAVAHFVLPHYRRRRQTIPQCGDRQQDQCVALRKE